MISNISKYERVYKILREQIEEGVYKIGDFIPTEIELEKMFGVSRTTVRKVVGMLINEGIVIPVQGRGTIVIDYMAVQKLNYVTSLTETLKEKGYEVSSVSIIIELVTPPPQIMEALMISPEDKTVRIQRVRLVNGKPIAIVVNYLLASQVPFIEKEANNINSLYNLLETKYHISIDSATECITAKLAGIVEADILQISEGSPLLVTKRTTYSKGRPIEYVVTSIIADKFEYSINMKGRPPKKS